MSSIREARRKARELASRRGGSQKGGAKKGTSTRQKIQPLEIEGQKYWRPYGIPYRDESGDVHLQGGEIWLKEDTPPIEVILMDSASTLLVPVHSITRAVDKEVLPRHQQKYALYKNYACTYNDSAGPEDFENWDPSEQWTATEDGKLHELRDEGADLLCVEVYEMEDGSWGINPPEAHPYQPKGVEYDTYDTREEAMFEAERMFEQARSCTFCADSFIETVNGVKWDKTRASRRREIGLIPFFDRSWLTGVKPDDGKDVWSLRSPNKPVKTPKVGEHACMNGWHWVSTSTYNDSWHNYHQYLATLHSICSNCLGEHGEVLGRREHKIEVEQLRCPCCGGVAVDSRAMRAKKLYAEAEKDDRTGEEDWTTAGIYQLLNWVDAQCPHCDEWVALEPVMSCSSCDNPTPLQAHEVVTVIKAVRKENRKVYTFSEKYDDGTDQLFRPDWFEPAVVPSGLTVEECVRPGIEAAERKKFSNFLDIIKTGEIPVLSTEDQARLIDAEVIDLNSRFGSKR